MIPWYLNLTLNVFSVPHPLLFVRFTVNRFQVLSQCYKNVCLDAGYYNIDNNSTNYHSLFSLLSVKSWPYDSFPSIKQVSYPIISQDNSENSWVLIYISKRKIINRFLKILDRKCITSKLGPIKVLFFTGIVAIAIR